MCYDCYMTASPGQIRIITHRELRNNSSEVLRAVRAGEIVEVTNHGEVSAVLVPPSVTPFQRLVVAGKVRQAEDHLVDLRSLPRAVSGLSSAEIIADLRGDR